MVHPEPTLLHSFYNHHVETFELVEETVKQGLIAASTPFKDCVTCASSFIRSIPDYIDSRIKILELAYDQS